MAESIRTYLRDTEVAEEGAQTVVQKHIRRFQIAVDHIERVQVRLHTDCWGRQKNKCVCVCVCVCARARVCVSYFCMRLLSVIRSHALPAAPNQSRTDFQCDPKHFIVRRLRVIINEFAEVRVLEVGDEVVASAALRRWVYGHAWSRMWG